MHRILEAFLRDIAGLVDKINTYTLRGEKQTIPLLAISFTLTLIVSVSDVYPLWMAAALYTLTMTIIDRGHLKDIAKTLAYLLLIALLTGLPILFTGSRGASSLGELLARIETPGTIKPIDYASFVTRITLAPLPVVSTLYLLGWPSTARSLYKYKPTRKLAALLSLTIIQIPRTIRYALSVMLAREARLFDHGLRREWRSLSTVVGDLLIHSVEYSKQMQTAIEARTFTKYPYEVGEGHATNN